MKNITFEVDASAGRGRLLGEMTVHVSNQGHSSPSARRMMGLAGRLRTLKLSRFFGNLLQAVRTCRCLPAFLGGAWAEQQNGARACVMAAEHVSGENPRSSAPRVAASLDC